MGQNRMVYVKVSIEDYEGIRRVLDQFQDKGPIRFCHSAEKTKSLKLDL